MIELAATIFVMAVAFAVTVVLWPIVWRLAVLAGIVALACVAAAMLKAVT
jgi:hypothetical protein